MLSMKAPSITALSIMFKLQHSAEHGLTAMLNVIILGVLGKLPFLCEI
jgi:hypothetical protein